MLTIPIMSPETDKSRNTFLEDLKACGADRVLICCCEFFSEGKEREHTLNELKKNIEFYTEAGLKPGIWTNTLGWGDPRDEKFKSKFDFCACYFFGKCKTKYSEYDKKCWKRG